VWQLSNQGKNQVEFRQVDAASTTFDTVTVMQRACAREE